MNGEFLQDPRPKVVYLSYLLNGAIYCEYVRLYEDTQRFWSLECVFIKEYCESKSTAYFLHAGAVFEETLPTLYETRLKGRILDELVDPTVQFIDVSETVGTVLARHDHMPPLRNRVKLAHEKVHFVVGKTIRGVCALVYATRMYDV